MRTLGDVAAIKRICIFLLIQLKGWIKLNWKFDFLPSTLISSAGYVISYCTYAIFLLLKCFHFSKDISSYLS